MTVTTKSSGRGYCSGPRKAYEENRDTSLISFKSHQSGIKMEMDGLQDKEPLRLKVRQASLLEMLSDLPEEEQKRIEYEIMTPWAAYRRKEK